MGMVKVNCNPCVDAPLAYAFPLRFKYRYAVDVEFVGMHRIVSIPSVSAVNGNVFVPPSLNEAEFFLIVDVMPYSARLAC